MTLSIEIKEFPKTYYAAVKVDFFMGQDYPIYQIMEEKENISKLDMCKIVAQLLQRLYREQQAALGWDNA